MTSEEIVDRTISYVKQELVHAEGGHDWFHIARVHKNSMDIAEGEIADNLIVQLGALLHDIADSKFHNGDETVGPTKARAFMKSIELDDNIMDHVIAIIENISFKGGRVKQNFKSIELDIVQDADRLDAIGAVGIARCFNYGGFKDRAIYDPSIAPNMNMTKEEYKKSKAPTINHFYEKLLLLKDRMNTATGRNIAASRHDFMLQFLEQFYVEAGRNSWDI